MDFSRALIVPDTWMKEAHGPEERLDNQPFFRVIPVPGYENLAKGQLTKAITSVLKTSGVQSALVVLPVEYAAGAFIKHWPELFMHTKLGVLISSVCFADRWVDCLTIAESAANTAGWEEVICNASCQYQPPYTTTFNLWERAGARSLHPGDYSRDEFLSALNKMKGHWLYWGHSDHTKLRAYHHLYSEDLLSHKPGWPLQSTLWFSCSTLGGNNRKSIALDWFLSGATRCMMAGLTNMDTTANQLLSAAFLEAVEKNGGTSLDGILYHLLTRNEQTFGSILNQYRLMGPPWVKFGLLTTEEVNS